MRRGFMIVLAALVSGTSIGVGLSSRASAAAPATTRPVGPAVVDASTMNGKVMCGYQGWFNTPGDGANRGWIHWARNRDMAPGNATVEMLPDMTELGPDERFATNFKYADGRPVEVFSSYNPKTVARHFQWMRDYGIDGVFLQRFVTGIGHADAMRHYDRILDNVRKGAAEYGRAYGLMYDLSGMKDGEADKVIGDFKAQVDQTKFIKDKQYIHQNGKPVVVLWGIGFGNGEKRPHLFADGLKLVEFLKNDPTYGGNTVMIGVPGNWRDLQPRAPDTREAFEKVLRAADIIQPWAVGSAGNLEDLKRNAEHKWKPDVAWASANGRQFMPVIFPGFSWYNLKPGAKFDQIPRLGGRFLWQQFLEAKRLNMPMVYVAMFDEVDEGTAIFKVTSDVPPDGKSRFLGLGGLPSDHYLKVVGQGTRLMRGEITPDQETVIKESAAAGQ